MVLNLFMYPNSLTLWLQFVTKISLVIKCDDASFWIKEETSELQNDCRLKSIRHTTLNAWQFFDRNQFPQTKFIISGCLLGELSVSGIHWYVPYLVMQPRTPLMYSCTTPSYSTVQQNNTETHKDLTLIDYSLKFRIEFCIRVLEDLS